MTHISRLSGQKPFCAQANSSKIVSELGEVYYERREIRKALKCFLHALDSGADPRTHAFERWESWMLLGQFEKAWEESDRSGSSLRGRSSIAGGRVLIRCLRGLGDAIQFLRYARELRLKCDHLTLQAPSRLLPLCTLIPGIDEAISLDCPLDAADYDCEMECSDLPYLFRTTQFTIPSGQGYLYLSGERAAACPIVASIDRDRLKAGIVWAAASWNPSRSIPLAVLEPLSQIPDLAFFSLQRGPEAGQLRTFGNGRVIVNAEPAGGDIIDTMAVISNLDLVVSVDTMVAHLAGAMGKPVWTLLTYAADWRWMLDRPDTPWYSSMRLFRQSSPGDWGSVVTSVTRMLQKGDSPLDTN